MGYLNHKLITNNLLEELIKYDDKLLLLKYGLIYRKKDLGGIHVHRIIKEEIIKYHRKHKQDYESKQVIIDKLIKILVKKIRDVDSDQYIVEFNLSDDYAQINEILTMVKKDQKKYDLNSLIQLYTKYGKYLMYCTNKFSDSLNSLSEAEKLLKILEQKKQLRKAVIYENMGHNYMKMGLVKDALEYYKKVYKVRLDISQNNCTEIEISFDIKKNIENCLSILGEEESVSKSKELINQVLTEENIKPIIKSTTCTCNQGSNFIKDCSLAYIFQNNLRKKLSNSSPSLNVNQKN